MVLLEFKFQYVEAAVMVVVFVIIGMLLLEFRAMKEKIKERLDINNEGLKLKLQALERLTLFTERAGLQNLVNRIESMQMSAPALQKILVETIKAEYDYNITQQIYVSPEVWAAVTRLKDQNIYIINQLAVHMPADASAIDLSKRIIEYSLNHNAELNTVVLEALQFEAKKVID